MSTHYSTLNRDNQQAMGSCRATILKKGDTHSATLAHAAGRKNHIESASHLVVLSSASGGIGLSTLSALLSWELAANSNSCALVDADFSAGGLDVLLGIENETGLRIEQIHAPLGYVDGKALTHQLPSWNRVSVLAYNAWEGNPPQPWEFWAIVKALLEVNSAVIVDCGRGEEFIQFCELEQAIHIVAVDLSVLGLARAKTRIKEIRASCAEFEIVPHILAVGITSIGGAGSNRTVDISDARAYLQADVLGPLQHTKKIRSDIVLGLGIRSTDKDTKHVMREITRYIEQYDAVVGRARADEALRTPMEIQ